ncbi:MAG: hypothetical protein Q9201_006754 [Fulgogasparrea decipioides]
MAMMPSASSGNPYDNLNNTQIEQDLIDPDDANINDLDEPNEPTSDRAPLTGNIQSSSRNPLPQSYLNSTIPGEDRRAPTNTIDESVWETLSRDLLAVWEKMRQVLWPKYLLGGFLQRGGGLGGAERAEGDSLAGGFRGIAGRWPDADVVLQGGMSEGLRDWDLWGPLIFCLLLSLLLSMTVSSEQKTTVFSGVFALIWIGEAVVTAQIKLLGGNISFFQSVCIIGYTLFPLVVAALLSAVHLPMIARIPVYIVLVAWSLAAGISILGGSGVVKNRVGIAIVDRHSNFPHAPTPDNRNIYGYYLSLCSALCSAAGPLWHIQNQRMTEDTKQPNAVQAEVTASDAHSGLLHTQDSTHLHPTTHDSASDNDTSEGPVREKLKKTSIQSMAKDGSAPGPTMDHSSNTDSERPQEQGSPPNRTPSPTSESRGRLSRKRSYDDSIEPVVKAGQPSKNNRDVQDDVKHARKRSRDVHAARPQETRYTATPAEQSLPEGASDDDIGPENGAPDREMEDTIRSPGKKRSGDELDTDSHRGQKIAATDEAKASRRSEDSERNQELPQGSKDAVSADNNVQKEPQGGSREESVSEQTNPSIENPKALQVESQAPSLQTENPKAQAQHEDAGKALSRFAASGFAAMSRSSTSPFGSLCSSTTSVFKSKETSEFTLTGAASSPMNGFKLTQTSGSAADTNLPSPFLSSTVATSTSPFAANGAISKPTGFGASTFGSGFASPAAGAPRLTSFAAPTGDLVPPKPAESGKTFGAPADPSREEEEDGSEDDPNHEEVGVGSDEVDSRFQQQEVETGENGERSIFISPRAQLYFYDRSGWHEKGKGTFKLNVADDAREQKEARFIMRAHQTFRVLLNQPVFRKMQVGDSKGREPQGKNVCFAVIDEGRPTPHLLKLGDESEAKALYHEVSRLQQDLETQA